MLGTLLLDLDIKIVEEHNNDVPAGEVIKTEPAADTPLSVGHEVTLYVSLGAEPGTMPNLVGKEREDAEAFLSDAVEQLKLDVVYEEVMEPEVPAGCVVRTDPAADVEIKTGEKITVYVNIAGKLPNVVNLSADIAVNLLKEEKFQNYKIETVENEKPKDTVLELCVDGAAVAPGTAIDVSSQVIIVVSTGPGAQTNPGEQITKTVQVDLPDEYLEAYTVTVQLAGAVIFEQNIPEGGEVTQVSVSMTGSGVQEYSVYINGALDHTKEVDFTK
jgi:beta-lactam-binding protein with PASTA domain